MFRRNLRPPSSDEEIFNPPSGLKSEVYSCTLKMKAAGSFETLITIYQSTRRHAPENCNLHFHDGEIVASHSHNAVICAKCSRWLFVPSRSLPFKICFGNIILVQTYPYTKPPFSYRPPRASFIPSTKLIDSTVSVLLYPTSLQIAYTCT
jgi:hypothetical protein